MCHAGKARWVQQDARLIWMRTTGGDIFVASLPRQAKVFTKRYNGHVGISFLWIVYSGKNSLRQKEFPFPGGDREFNTLRMLGFLVSLRLLYDIGRQTCNIER